MGQVVSIKKQATVVCVRKQATCGCARVASDCSVLFFDFSGVVAIRNKIYS